MSDEKSAPAETEKPKGTYTPTVPKPAVYMRDGLLVEPGDDEHDRFIDGMAEVREQARKAASRRPD